VEQNAQVGVSRSIDLPGSVVAGSHFSQPRLNLLCSGDIPLLAAAAIVAAWLIFNIHQCADRDFLRQKRP
jgi:hypothetical protein